MVRLPYRDENHLYFPAASVFVHPDESFMEQHRLRIKAIRVSFDLPPGWFPATSWGVGKLRYELDPPNLNHLYLALIGLGSYRTYQASFDGLHLQTAILNQGCVAADSQFISDDRISNAIRLAFTTGRQVFGFYPLARHFSLIHFVFDNPGRINGSALGWSINLNYSRSFSRTQWVEMESHIFSEIFHLWNGTQDAPLSRSQDDHSTIWFTEGITHFYRLKNMVRSGVISEEEYFQLVGEEFTRVYHSSRGGDDLNKISEGYYTDREAMRMTYSKGCCLAFALDVLMRHIYADQKSFDDVMRTMLKRYDFRVNGHCYTHGELDSVLMDVLGAEQFSHYRKLFSGGFIKEFQHITEMVGLEIERERGERLYFGITNFGPPSVPAFLIDGMDRESPAFKAGIREKDILLEINGQLLQENVGLKKYVEGLSDKKPVDLTIRRGDRTLRIRTPWLSFQSKFKIRRR
jgi:predicted metalloprotease with PDZ domain